MTYEKMPDLSLAQTGEKGRKKPLPVWVIYLLPSLLIFALFTIYPLFKDGGHQLFRHLHHRGDDQVRGAAELH